MRRSHEKQSGYESLNTWIMWENPFCSHTLMLHLSGVFLPPLLFLPAHFACDRLLAVSIKAAQHDNILCVLWDGESLIADVNCTNRVGSTSERLFEMYVGASFMSQEVKHLWQWTEHALKYFLHIYLINSVSVKDIQGVYLVILEHNSHLLLRKLFQLWSFCLVCYYIYCIETNTSSVFAVC